MVSVKNAAKRCREFLFNMYSVEEKKYLLNLARQSILYYLEQGELLTVDKNEISEIFKRRLACFVTLTLDGELRGCIGHTEPVQELYLDVIENSVAAAFEDPRFLPVDKNEAAEIKIEISVLSLPIRLVFDSPGDLLDKLQPGRDGVIIRFGRHGATYLPQVWEEIGEPEDFLNSLCAKADLPSACWRESDFEAYTYTVENFSE